MEQITFAIIKPDVVEAGNFGLLLDEIQSDVGRVVAMRMVHLTREQAGTFYAEHLGKSFYPGLIDFMVSGPCVVLAVRGEDAVQKYRKLMGPTDPRQAPEGTLRSFYGGGILPQNAVHGSDSEDSARRELAQFFPELAAKLAAEAGRPEPAPGQYWRWRNTGQVDLIKSVDDDPEFPVEFEGGGAWERDMREYDYLGAVTQSASTDFDPGLYKNGRAPHCDQRVLHAPGKCSVCDEYAPAAQAARKYRKVSFTGESALDCTPCPADFARGLGAAHVWHGNRPVKD